MTLNQYTNPACPKCGKETKEKIAKTSGKKFYGCSEYPNCDGVVWINNKAQTPKTESNEGSKEELMSRMCAFRGSAEIIAHETEMEYSQKLEELGKLVEKSMKFLKTGSW